MSQKPKANPPPLPASGSNGSSNQTPETNIRQLIAEGKSRNALENAKQFHKARNSPESEGLLLDTYLARIQSLLDQKLAPEANSLIDLVRERFPAAKSRLEVLMATVSVRGGELTGLLQPLNDPQLTPDRRAAIELLVQNEVADLPALAVCAALPPEHSLRQAAAALDAAFKLVTSGPVTDEQIELPEVSHRSPLAPWKVLIRAIASFHRGEDQACQDYLAAIKPESVPSRLVPSVRATLGQKPPHPLKPAESALVAATGVSLSELHRALENIDHEFNVGHDDSRLFKDVRTAIRECQRNAPDCLGPLKQRIEVRCRLIGLDIERLTSAMDGPPRMDAEYFRMLARSLESTGEAEDIVEACEAWEQFREEAVRENWFPAKGIEVAALYLHMAEISARLPDDLLGRNRRRKRRDADPYFLFPEDLYARACLMDPHPEAFSQWMRWAEGQPGKAAEDVAQQWNKIRPGDLEPLLYLMNAAEKRNALPTALSYLDKAERIDPVHSQVRAARLHLLASAAIRHLQQNKPHLAAEKVALIDALPQARQGHRPAFLATMRHLIALLSGKQKAADEAFLEVETALGGRFTAQILIFGIASLLKRMPAIRFSSLEQLSQAEKASLPKSLATVLAITSDLGILKTTYPEWCIIEAEKQFPQASASLDVVHLRQMGRVGLNTERPKLAWAVSAAGLERGGPTEAYFLWVRARLVPPTQPQRYDALTAASIELGRFHGDTEVVDQAVQGMRDPFERRSSSLTLDQAREVLKREVASPAYPDSSKKAPDYSDLVPDKVCNCPDCHRRRGESPGPFDDDEDEFGFEEEDRDDDFDFDFDGPFLGEEAEIVRAFKDNAPKDMPPWALDALIEGVTVGLRAGKSPEEIMAGLLAGLDGLPGRGGKKSKKKGRKNR